MAVGHPASDDLHGVKEVGTEPTDNAEDADSSQCHTNPREDGESFADLASNQTGEQSFDDAEIHLIEVGDVAITKADEKHHGIQRQHNSGCNSQHHDGYHLAARPLFKIQLSHSLLQLLHGFDILASLRSKKKIA